MNDITMAAALTNHSADVAIATTGTIVTALVATYLIKNYFYHRESSLHQNCVAAPKDLIGNKMAKGSDVVKIYSHKVQNKTFLTTGATSGFGRHMALLLGGAGARVILGVRDVEKGNEVVQQIISQQQQTIKTRMADHIVLQLDLSSLESVRLFAHKIQASLNNSVRIDGILNNAGVLGVKGQTVDNYQLTWQTNAMAPALLTNLLLPLLTDQGRVVNVSSEVGRMVSGSIAEQCPPSREGDSLWDYGLSKAYQVLHAHQLSRNFLCSNSSRRAMAVEPGLVVDTNIFRHNGTLKDFLYTYLLGPFVGRSLDQGSATPLFCLLASPTDLGDDNDGVKTASSKNKNDENDDGTMVVPKFYYADCAPTSLPTRSCQDKNEVEALVKLHSKIFGETKSS